MLIFGVFKLNKFPLYQQPISVFIKYISKELKNITPSTRKHLWRIMLWALEEILVQLLCFSFLNWLSIKLGSFSGSSKRRTLRNPFHPVSIMRRTDGWVHVNFATVIRGWELHVGVSPNFRLVKCLKEGTTQHHARVINMLPKTASGEPGE